MLRIRFSRTGKVGQPSYRIVVAEHRAPVKGRYIEILGHYMPALKEKNTVVDKERVAYWISKGAIPSDTAASLFKRQHMENMDRYIEPRTRKRNPKGEQAEEKAAPAKALAATAPAAEKAAPAEAPPAAETEKAPAA